ncbi:succinyl-diaminopimelate desuccinylase [Rhizosaccharibacter radicis]|uniref:Succinyl-diaminopimelate desuccinylase n=1 Tax=Rhizosaccharibacter radicis TaxID=2782605 RepID=A0ABT1VVC8_9PROT|nr:succinyl-diaminopimelate desuccinylase [Acetobacteraceae bacterium KSS12]
MSGATPSPGPVPRGDALAIARALIRRPSVTPADAGAQAVLASMLREIGFEVFSLPFGDGDARIENLFARIGTGSPHLCFAGHTDVVPPGDPADWRSGPFAAEMDGDVLVGRGAADMKGGIAAFVAAAGRHLADRDTALSGSISLLITGDEEGDAVNGTVRVLEWMAAHGQIPDFCLVGEPTNPERLGEMVKIGRRGTLNATVTVEGTQGHAAYPDRADNPVHRLLRILSDLTSAALDEGTPFFQPSSLQVTSVDVGNGAFNVIPARAGAKLNIRFNDLHDGASLSDMLRATVARHAPRGRVDIRVGGEAFRTDAAPEVALLVEAIEAETGRRPVLDTGGGTSDARFVARYCGVAEFGLVGASMHKVDENVPVGELKQLQAIYERFIRRVMG